MAGPDCLMWAMSGGWGGTLQELAERVSLVRGERFRFTNDPARERLLYRQPTGPNPLYHRDDLVDRPRAMGV